MVKQKYVRELSWVKRGKQRRGIIAHVDGPRTPTEVAKKSGYSLNNTSRVLKDLEENGLARCLNPKEKTGRLYVLTRKGKAVKELVSQ